ncbi:hypothetical protein [Conyzicola sp.]|uniref:hypothetical protein n=1 Tax=Conyzicola sp. TaxID=1969404 RepID=UPI0039898400
MARTPTERARRLWRWSAAAVAAGLLVAVASIFLPVAAFALSIVAAVFFVAAVLVGAIAANQTTRRPELTWIIAGILVFWVANSALYLHLVVEANSLVGTVPPQEAIDLLGTLFAAGTTALIAAVILTIVGWAVRPGRWSALHGPSGQS